MRGNTLRLVDTHFHADLQDDAGAVLNKCERDGVYTVAVTNAPSVFSHTQELANGLKFVRPSVGLHPELIHSHAQELPDLLRLMCNTKYVGEVGLDYVTTDSALRKKQRDVFEAILGRCAELGGRILTVHSRRAAADVVSCARSVNAGIFILHWFSGAKKELVKAVNAGCFFSVNPAMVVSEKSLSLIREVPRERILTETDGPFVRVGGRGAIPSDVRLAIDGLSKLWNLDIDETAAVVFRNFTKIVQEVSA